MGAYLSAGKARGTLPGLPVAEVVVMPDVDQVLAELKKGLEDIYGPRLRGLYLFRSRARGEAEEDADIDVAVVLDEVESPYREIDRWNDFVSDLCLRHTCLVGLVPIAEEEWQERQTPFLMNVRREGVAVR
ncbi:MAG: nucleotidyltransferase domain-containing protein [Armatimonadota bacterium]